MFEGAGHGQGSRMKDGQLPEKKVWEPLLEMIRNDTESTTFVKLTGDSNYYYLFILLPS